MLSVLILVCATSISASECTKANATQVLYAPEPADNAAGCLMGGMFYAAQSNTVVKGYYPKIICQPPEVAAQARRD
ncbi:MAG: hypothetical protein U1E46_18360 [Hyphomicrobiales bacterium]